MLVVLCVVKYMLCGGQKIEVIVEEDVVGDMQIVEVWVVFFIKDGVLEVVGIV